MSYDVTLTGLCLHFRYKWCNAILAYTDLIYSDIKLLTFDENDTKCSFYHFRYITFYYVLIIYD